MIKYYLLVFLLLLSACSSSPQKQFDGKKLLQEKCSQCHNLDLPPQTFEDEIAPPMMAVSFHIVGFMQTPDESMRVPKAIAFVKDYVINPSASKSFCDKKSLEDYGIMPSQKGNVTEGELVAISRYMFSHFTQKNLDKAQKELNKFEKMPAGKKIALKNNCLTCHRIDKDLVGPSFKKIADKYQNAHDIILQGIQNGSRKKWVSSKGAIMPPFKKLSDKELQTVTKWILTQ